MLDLVPVERLNVARFVAIVEQLNGRHELIDGQVVARPMCTFRHAEANGQLLAGLFHQLKGQPAKPLGSQMGLRLEGDNVRYPDGAVYDDPRDLSPAMRESYVLHHPRLVFEGVDPLEPDHSGRQLAEYKTLPSVAVILMVDVARRVINVHERTGPAAWTQREVARGGDLILADPSLTLTAAEIFGDA